MSPEAKKTDGYVEHEKRGHELPSRYESRWRLKITLFITAGMMLVEFAGGYIAHSLALISDAWHMFTHSFALGMSFVAILIASRPSSKEKSFGLYRVEILAAFLNGIFLLVVIGVIFWHAFDRLVNPVAINAVQVFWIGLLGLVVNLVCAGVLHGSSHNDLNIRGAYMHMITDTLSSVGVVAAAGIIYFTEWHFLDPLMSIVIGVLILRWAVDFLKDSVNILMESTPKHIRLDEVQSALKKEIPEIRKIHDMHVWEITSNMYSMTAHFIIPDVRVSEGRQIIERANKVLSERFHIEHTNLQLESHEHD